MSWRGSCFPPLQTTAEAQTPAILFGTVTIVDAQAQAMPSSVRLTLPNWNLTCRLDGRSRCARKWTATRAIRFRNS